MAQQLTPEQRDKYLKAIEKIETLPRPQKWREIKKFLLELHPQWKTPEKEHCQAVKEIRQKLESKTAASQSGTMRETMKLFGPVYEAMIKLDPQLMIELSGRNKGAQEKIGKQLYQAFPEYRIARMY